MLCREPQEDLDIPVQQGQKAKRYSFFYILVKKVLQSHYAPMFRGFFNIKCKQELDICFQINFYLCLNTSTFPKQCHTYGILFWTRSPCGVHNCRKCSLSMTYYIKFRKVKIHLWNSIWLVTTCSASHSFTSILVKSNCIL